MVVIGTVIQMHRLHTWVAFHHSAAVSARDKFVDGESDVLLVVVHNGVGYLCDG